MHMTKTEMADEAMVMATEAAMHMAETEAAGQAGQVATETLSTRPRASWCLARTFWCLPAQTCTLSCLARAI
jgi:hypothetical protein